VTSLLERSFEQTRDTESTCPPHLLGSTLEMARVAARGGEIGAPEGYHLTQRSAPIPSSVEAFQAVARHIATLGMQRGAGLAVYAPMTSSDGVADGDVVVCGAGVGALVLPVPCRIVWTRHEPAFAGFGYATLPGHPEQGEEAFWVARTPDGRAHVGIAAFSRPGRWFTRLGAPVGRLVQRWVSGRYLASARAMGVERS
jgi:uncharacterized protein (UPF0548 family)